MTISRLCAGTLLVGSVALICLFILATLTGAGAPNAPLTVPLESLEAVAGLAVLLGFPALLIGHPRRGRRLTLAGYVGVFAICAYVNVFISLVMALVLPWVSAHGVATAHGPAVIGAIFFVMGPVQVIATALLAAGALRAGRRIAGWLFVASAAVDVLSLAPLPEFIGTISAVLLFLGIAIIAAGGVTRREASVAPSPVVGQRPRSVESGVETRS